MFEIINQLYEFLAPEHSFMHNAGNIIIKHFSAFVGKFLCSTDNNGLFEIGSWFWIYSITS
jgi:hypothetical protein